MKRERGSTKRGCYGSGVIISTGGFSQINRRGACASVCVCVCVCVCACVCVSVREVGHISTCPNWTRDWTHTERRRQPSRHNAYGQVANCNCILSPTLSLFLSLSHTHTYTHRHTVLPVLACCPTRNEDWGPIALRAEDSLWIDFQYATRGLSKTESRIILPPSPPLPVPPHFLFSPSHWHSPLSLFSRSFHPFIPLGYRSLSSLSTGCLHLPLCFLARSSFDSVPLVRLHTSLFFCTLHLCLKTIYHSVPFFFSSLGPPLLSPPCVLLVPQMVFYVKEQLLLSHILKLKPWHTRRHRRKLLQCLCRRSCYQLVVTNTRTVASLIYSDLKCTV